MTELNIRKKCDWCSGTGLMKNGEGATVTCTSCTGSGKETLHTIDITDLQSSIDAIKSDTANILDAVASIKSTVETDSGKIDNLQSTVDKILEIVQKIGG